MVEIIDGKKKMIVSVDSYQYIRGKSTPKNFNYDANWLNVAVAYADNDVADRVVDPCLMTTELEEMVEALEAILDGKEESYISDFLEPYFQIAFVRDNVRVAVVVHFTYDTTDRPWKIWKAKQFLSYDEAVTFLNGLKRMCTMFPCR